MIKTRILLVDDDPALTRVLKTCLEQDARYEVRIENDPRNALDAAREFRPDLVLLDLIMPHMDGGVVALCLRTHPALRDVPIVFLTGIISKELVSAQGVTIGQHTFLAKPVDTKSLLDCVEREISRRAA